MGRRAIDVRGKRFGRLAVMERHFMDVPLCHSVWLCRCDCGAKTIVRGDLLRKGITRSCGCLAIELSKLRITHGREGTPEYHIWEGIINRCSNLNDEKYGGRGIRACDRWKKFENFYSDMGSRPSPGHSIDRRNNDRGYDKDNCRWATAKEQQRNRRDNVIVKFRGKSMLLMEAAELTGASYYRAYARIKLGWDVGRALFEHSAK